MVKDRRCNLFDDDGRRRRLRDGTKGCFRDASACHFAHPHEREWESALSSSPPKHELVDDSDSDFYYSRVHPNRRDWEIQRERRKRGARKPHHFESPLHRKDSTITRGSPGPPSRKSTLDTAIDSLSGTTKRGSPALSISSDHLLLRREDRHRNDLDLPPLRQDHASSAPRRSRSRSGDKGREHERVDMPSKTPLVNHIPDAQTRSIGGLTAQHSPPEPLKPSPMQPPPPPPLQLPEVPNLPSFASAHQPSSSENVNKELSMDKQRSVWHERIDLMFTSIVSRRDYAKLEADLTQIRLLSDSHLANKLPEADRANINAQKMALELKMEVKRKQINDIIQKLIGSEFWPALKAPQISDMEKILGETKKHVLDLRCALDEVKKSCAALLKTSVTDWAEDSERPSKRRKLDGKAETLEQPTSGDAENDSAKELDALRDRITELDCHLIDLENEIHQRDKIISDEIELHIDARLEAEDALYSPVEQTVVSQAEIEAVVNAKNKELALAVTVTGEEIGVLAVEVAELITKVNTLESRCMALEAENHEFKNKLTQDVVDHANSQDALVCRDKEIKAIAAALQAYISQAPAGQAADDLPSAEYIVESLNSQLDGLFREKFGTTLVNLQQDIFDKVQENRNRTVDIISPKIKLLLNMVNLITARLGKSDVEAVNAG